LDMAADGRITEHQLVGDRPIVQSLAQAPPHYLSSSEYGSGVAGYAGRLLGIGPIFAVFFLRQLNARNLDLTHARSGNSARELGHSPRQVGQLNARTWT
jgi:hypothetical protein